MPFFSCPECDSPNVASVDINPDGDSIFECKKCFFSGQASSFNVDEYEGDDDELDEDELSELKSRDDLWPEENEDD